MAEVLRDYQREMLLRLEEAWGKHRSVMVQMPTGTGKTHVMAAVIREHAVKGVLVVAHRMELIGQISRTLAVFGVAHGIIDRRTKDAGAVMTEHRVVVASIQTLSRRIEDGMSPCAPGLVVVDEAHHAMAKTYRMLWDRWPEARFLGLTATPCRLSGEAFADLFRTLIQSWSIQTFIDKGYLSDFEYVSASPNSEAMKQVRKLSKRGADGDYQAKELTTVMDVPESIEHLYKTYKQFAGGKKGIVYAISRQHAQHILEYYRVQGVRCAMIDAKTPEQERMDTVTAYRDGAVDVLVNVDIFSEGFDCPEVEFIQLARPTLSLCKYLQQVGRGMRVSPGKPHVLILDSVGLYQTFGLPTEERDWKKTFCGQATGKGDASGARYVVLDEGRQEKELVNLEMVRIKKGGKKRAGLEIFLKDGRYGVMNNGKISCQSRFKEIVRLNDHSGFFAAGIYGGKSFGNYVEYASLIDWKGIDLGLRLYRDIEWQNGIYYSSYKPRGYKEGDDYWQVYWDPKGSCYYDYDPEFRTVAGVEVAETYEHHDQKLLCYKLRYNTGNLSPRFNLSDMFYNKYVIIARDYLVVKNDKNHAYHICGYFNDSVIVQKEDMSGYMSIGLDGKKGEVYRSLPQNLTRISPISYLYYLKELKLQCLWRKTPK